MTSTTQTTAPAGAGIAPAPAGAARLSKRQLRKMHSTPKHLRSNLTAFLMIAPLLILLAIFVIWPLVYAFYLSGYETYYNRPAEFVGLDFYKFVLTDPLFWSALWVGLKYSLLVVPTILVLSLLLASFIKTLSGKMAAILKTTVYVPAVVSVVLTGLVFVFMYQDSGVVNAFVGMFGIEPVAWLNNDSTVLAAISVPGIWLGFGISTLIMLAALLDIPESYYEAASLEGANWFQRTWYITIPMLKNVFLYLLVTGFTLAMQEYLIPLIMTNGGPVNATTTTNLFIFNQFRDTSAFAFTYSITAALILFVVLGLLSLLIFKAIKSDKAVDG
ncbi:carbohydrate ABC transporter permease [Nakamurella aerolata]|nr:sugar ABC transporter permease [Nakamurella aerolata]